ncbi:uncharacterized protein LOC141523877 [Cotesia typhae]|uniref:uncharacterized protein LOC141523877 n=1 Tax=Cotesia typhae TaxID=2053667 RepID=UPI003D69386C
MIKFMIFLSLVVFTSGHTKSTSESSKQKRSIFESPISSYGHGYPWTRSKNLLKVLKIPSELSLLPTRSIVSYGSAVRPPSPLVVTKHIIVEKQIPVPGKPVIYEKQVPIHVPVHVPVKVPVDRFVPVTVEKSVPVPVPQVNLLIK